MSTIKISRFKCSIAVVVVTVMLLLSCGHRKEGYISSNSMRIFNLDTSLKHLSLVSKVESIKYIGLETNENSVISDASSIRNVILRDGKYFVLDTKYMAIKVFDTAGKYLYSIGKLGMGKGEFVRVEMMTYSKIKNSIFVLCNSPSKLIEFSLDGKLIQDKTLNFWAAAVALDSPNNKVFYINQNKSVISGNKNVLLTDSNNIVKFKLFDLPKHISSMIEFSGGLYGTQEGIYFNPAFSPIYYFLSNDTAVPKFKIDYGAKSVTEDPDENEVMSNTNKYCFQFNTFIKNDSSLGFNYFNGKIQSAFINLNSGAIMTSNANVDSLNVLFSNLMFDANENYLTVLDINRLSGFFTRKSVEINARFPGLFDNMSSEKVHKNPGFLVFKLKKT